MAELMMVNPSRRRKVGRTAKQRAATRKLVALNRRKRRRPTARRPVKRRRTTARRTNPIRCKRRSPARRLISTVRKRRYKRNPSPRGMVNSTLIPAAVAGLGAVSLDVLWGFAPLPATLKTGPLRHLVKGAGAIALGWAAGMVVNKRTAGQLATGALTVVMYSAIRELTAKFLPSVPLGYYSAGASAGTMSEYTPGVGEYTQNMGAYIGGEGTSPYLAADPLSQPFAGPSAATVSYAEGMRAGAALENEQNMGNYYD